MGPNTKVAEQSKKRIEARFGPGLVWILNPGAKDFALPDGARGPEYMLMWTKVLEGDSGLGKDFAILFISQGRPTSRSSALWAAAATCKK